MTTLTVRGIALAPAWLSSELRPGIKAHGCFAGTMAIVLRSSRCRSGILGTASSFAGEDIDQAVFYPEDDHFLSTCLMVRHYDVVD